MWVKSIESSVVAPFPLSPFSLLSMYDHRRERPAYWQVGWNVGFPRVSRVESAIQFTAYVGS